MIRRFVSMRTFAVALLAAAQLGAALHAAEHGVGEHEHDGVTCVYGAVNDDDVLAPPPSAATPRLLNRSGSFPTAEQDTQTSSTGVTLPPATGPPGSH